MNQFLVLFFGDIEELWSYRCGFLPGKSKYQYLLDNAPASKRTVEVLCSLFRKEKNI